MKNLKAIAISSFIAFIPLAVLIILMSGVMYASVQNVLRTDANDPQIQMAQDASAALGSGANPQNVLPVSTVNIAQSLAPYMIIYDTNGQVVASSAVLNGQTPIVPPGVLTSARTMDVNWLTWQPQPGVRSAIAVVAYHGGYVLVGRSLRLVEQRETDLEQIIGLASIIMLVLVYGATLFSDFARHFVELRRSQKLGSIQNDVSSL